MSGQSADAGALVAVGSAVRVQRKALGLSQEALADLSKIDRSHMGKIERGERNVTLLNLLRVSRALKLKPSELLENAGL